jgi:hypothetical protein
MEQHRFAAQVGADHFDRSEEISPDTVHFIDISYTGSAVSIGLPPHRLRLRLHPGYGTEYANGSIEYPQGTLYLNSKVHMPGRVDNIDNRIFPSAGRSSGGNGYTPFLLLAHPIHSSGTFIDFSHAMNLSRVEKDPLGGSSLAGVYMGHNADISYSGQI